MDRNSAVMGVFFLAVVGMLLRPVVVALARRLNRDSAEPGLSDEIAELREHVAELDQLHTRVHELEERLDFTERVLAQRSEPAPLPPGGMVQ